VVYLEQTRSLSGQPPHSALQRRFWWQAALLAVLIGWLYGSILFHLARQWSSDADFSHGFFVPIFSLFLLWRDRDRLAREPHEPSSWGLLIVVFSLSVLVAGLL
jgi:hypothetical protein